LAGRTVLVVEDHADSRRLFVQMLDALGARVLEAADGELALAVLEQERPDLVLCDLRMPVVDGLEFTVTVRQDARFRELPVIAVTAYGDNGDYLATWDAGFDAHLVKPIEIQNLAMAIARALAVRASEQARRRSRLEQSHLRSPPSRRLPPPAFAVRPVTAAVARGQRPLRGLEVLPGGRQEPAPLSIPGRPNRLPRPFGRRGGGTT
jgi:CheY-like chemotaxis protein